MTRSESIRSGPVSVPTLDALAANPALVEELPPEIKAILYRLAARVEASLRADLLGLRPERGASAEAPGDILLTIEDAAESLAMSKDFLYRNWKRLGLGYKDEDGHVKFPLSAVRRYVERRARR